MWQGFFLFLCTMAQLKAGLIVTDMRGGLGGSNLQRGKSSLIARNKPVPRNKNTPSRNGFKLAFAQASNYWLLMLESDRQYWATLAQGSKFTNRFGDSYTPTARTYFLKFYANKAYYKIPLVSLRILLILMISSKRYC